MNRVRLLTAASVSGKAMRRTAVIRTSVGLWGAAVVLAACIPSMAAHATRRELVLYSFTAGSDGSNPDSSLVMDRKGNVYGTTGAGGIDDCNPQPGCGTVFKLTPKDRESVVLSFDYADDYAPVDLIKGKNWNLYGTTGGGGAGYGTVFELARDGTETVIYSFKGGNDGYGPGALIADAAGDLIGTTGNGGGSTNCRVGCGTVFEIAPDGTETILHAFTGMPDGAFPSSRLVADDKGNFYGTTSDGGQSCPYRTDGCGTVFMLAPDGTETVLYAFCLQTDCTDGYWPDSLIRDSAGNLYGTTIYGGNQQNGGTIFKLSPGGSETVLYTFCSRSNCNDGSYPTGLIMDRNGRFYGTTAYGGEDAAGCGLGCGTVYKLSADGTETVLHSFSNRPDGAEPNGVIMDGNGNLFGTTYAGGANRYGSVFEIVK